MNAITATYMFNHCVYSCEKCGRKKLNIFDVDASHNKYFCWKCIKRIQPYGYQARLKANEDIRKYWQQRLEAEQKQQELFK